MRATTCVEQELANGPLYSLDSVVVNLANQGGSCDKKIVHVSMQRTASVLILPSNVDDF